jgi:transketolase
MRELGWLRDEALNGYFADGSDLKVLSDSCNPVLEVSSSSLSHSFSVRVCIAMVAKLRSTDQKTYAVLGNRVINEFPIWEDSMLAAHNSLKNLTVIFAMNGFQAIRSTHGANYLVSMKDKFKSFDFEVCSIDGYDEAPSTMTSDMSRLALQRRLGHSLLKPSNEKNCFSWNITTSGATHVWIRIIIRKLL